ncbi:hypothetical protein APHAL10511_002448 [Amanita phalloides]|nr:hypothetical protein APHAL10511_002448 [Amanita phalloides]
MTPMDSYTYDELPNEIWCKVIALVLSDSIYAICCSSPDVDLSWDRIAFGTLRLVSRAFGERAVKVADLALSNPQCCGYARRLTSPEEQPEETDMVIEGDGGKIRKLYEKFNLLNTIQSASDPVLFFADSGISLLSAYYGYVQLIKNSKIVFARNTTAQLDIVEKLYRVIPVAFRKVLIMLDLMTLPEMVDRLRLDVERDEVFVSSGLEIIYRLSETLTRGEWRVSSVSEDFKVYLDDLCAALKKNGELYTATLKQQGLGDCPAILQLPGVRVATGHILDHDYQHAELADLVRSWSQPMSR